MAIINDFIKIQKKDSCKLLQYGMRYSSYVLWAGFFVPGFPENGICDDEELQEKLEDYILLRIITESDVHKLLSLSVSDSIADSVKKLEIVIPSFVLKMFEDSESLIPTLKEDIEKYSEKIEIVPKIGFFLNGDFAADNDVIEDAKKFTRYDCFSSTVVFGDINAQNLRKIKSLLEKSSLKEKKISVCCKKIKSESEFFDIFKETAPDSIINLRPNLYSSSISEYLKKSNTVLKITPEIMCKNFEINTDRAQSLRKFFDDGIKIEICSGRLLYTNKSISEFATELCNSGLFTKEEIIDILS